MGWYRFGDFELDLDTFVLRCKDEVLPMQPKVFDVLRHLVEQRGRVVTKAELLQELWRNEHVNEGAVAWSVSHIRRALGQQRGDKQPIETVPGRGYRFTAEVKTGTAPAAQPVAAPPVAAAPARPASTLVGRARAMSELRQCLSDAIAGRGGLCAITGEAGIGKTRCADELSAEAATMGVQTLLGRCPHEPSAPPLWPIAMALRGVGQDQPELAERIRALRALGSGDDAGGDGQAAVGFALIDRVARVLREVVALRPTLLILDDFHWADASTCSLLAFLAPELRELQLCVVITLRDGERDPGSTRDQSLRQLMRYAHGIPLGALDTAQVADLIQVVTRQRPGRELAEAVRRAAGGVPLFVQEVVRTLLLDHGEESLQRLAPDAVRVPELARDLLRQRVHRLPQPTVELLSHAAVIGETFDLSLLLAVADSEPDALLDLLEPALSEGQIASEAPHTYRFVHSLFQSVLYDDLPAAERIAIHRKLGNLLAARPDDEHRHGEIARHFYLSLPAGDHRAVLQYARTAGDIARREHEFEDAATYYGWALEAQAFGNAGEPRERAELMLALAGAQRVAGRIQEAMQAASRALELAQTHVLPDLAVRATRLRRPTVAMWMVPDAGARSALERVLELVPEGANPVRVSALSQLACLPPYDPDLARSKALSARAVTLAHELADPESEFEALRARLFVLSGPDDVDEVLKVAEQILALAAADSRAAAHAADARTARFAANLLAGRMAEADAALDQMKAAIAGRQLPEAAFYCERLAAQRTFMSGAFEKADEDWKAARRRALRAGVIYAEMFYGAHTLNMMLEREGARAVVERRLLTGPNSMWISTPANRANSARIASDAGELEYVRSQIMVLGDPSSLPRDGNYLNVLSSVAVCTSVLKDSARSEQVYGLLAPYPQFNTPSPMGYYLGAVAHFLGLLSATLGRNEEAERHFEHALARNREMGLRPAAVRTLIAHGKLAAQLGKAAVARDLLTRAANEARSLGMTPALATAEAALKAV